MDYKKPDKKAIKSWRIGQLISLAVIIVIAVPVVVMLSRSGLESPWSYIIYCIFAAVIIYAFISLVVFPQIEYKQWGYVIEDDKVVIKHGLFFIKKTIVPIIRIQNITVSQGPINRALGLYKVSLALASGSFEIEGLNRETADTISENLKKQLYERVKEKGVL